MNKLSLSSNTHKLCLLVNIFGSLGISGALVLAFYYQLFLYELPCPLCLLQRVGMIVIGTGFLFNIMFGIKNKHYGITILGCLITGIVATRQILLHILPDDLGYGSTLLNVHFYTWALIVSVLTLVAISFLLMISKGEVENYNSRLMKTLCDFSILLFTLVILANLFSTVLECGIGQCDDNPSIYQMLGE